MVKHLFSLMYKFDGKGPLSKNMAKFISFETFEGKNRSQPTLQKNHIYYIKMRNTVCVHLGIIKHKW